MTYYKCKMEALEVKNNEHGLFLHWESLMYPLRYPYLSFNRIIPVIDFHLVD